MIKDRKPYQWNISRIARRFQLHRDTVRRRLLDAEVPPVGVDETGAPTYDLADAAPAIFEKESTPGAHPECQRPIDRLYWYQSQNERLKLEVTTGLLRRVEDARRDMAEMIKSVVNTLETLPDVMERDFALSPEKIQQAADCIDLIRDDLYQKMIIINSEAEGAEPIESG